MIEENLRFLQEMVESRRDLYSILSFLSETIDTLRTDLMGHAGSDAAYDHLAALVSELEGVDRHLQDLK